MGPYFTGPSVTTWFLAHDMYVQQRGFHNSFYSQVFGACLIKSLLTFSLPIWINRNQFYFGATPQESSEKQHEKANTEISDAYDNKDTVPLQDHPTLFMHPLTTLLQMKIKHKRNWLRLYQVYTAPPPSDPAPIPAPLDPHIPDTTTTSTQTLHPFFHRFLSSYLPPTI